MVAVIENWAEFEGRVVSVQNNEDLTGYACARIEVRNVMPVAGYANLFEGALGKQIEINVPQAAAKSLRPGADVHLRARKATPTASFADPDSIRIL